MGRGGPWDVCGSSDAPSRFTRTKLSRADRRCSFAGEDGLTCVEYLSNGETLLGCYTTQSLVHGPHIRPLCASCEEDGISALLFDEDADAVPLSAVVRGESPCQWHSDAVAR